MPEDPRIFKDPNSSGFVSGNKETNVSLEELEELIRNWVNIILFNIDPPDGLWERIKQRAKGRKPLENSFHS
jgi:hypothetical protein